MTGLNFCTLLDARYLSRGLALHASLVAHCPTGWLYLFALDELSHAVLCDLALPRATVVAPAAFEDDPLRACRRERSRAEYAWTCTPAITLFALDHWGLDHCTYVDADVYFFGDPAPLVAELGPASVLLTEHRFAARHRRLARFGRFCVQFMTFRDDAAGRRALTWWREACLNWCYARVEPTRYGDQKYLDDWPERFSGVHVLRHRGGGVAPWNAERYRFSTSAGRLIGTEREGGESFEVLFAHFQNLVLHADMTVDLGHSRLTPDARRSLYGPYLRHLATLEAELAGSPWATELAAARPPRDPCATLRRRLHRTWQGEPLPAVP